MTSGDEQGMAAAPGAALAAERAGFPPAFAGGLLPAVVQDAASGEVLMLAWMNEEAWRLTLETGDAHFWSRSRRELWHKGGTSGHVQRVLGVRLDCDSDAILLLVEQAGGAACHTGRRSCFFREWRAGAVSECAPMVFDPAAVYGKATTLGEKSVTPGGAPTAPATSSRGSNA